jgi:hypothetical protein
MRFQDGTLLLDGKSPEELGVPQWRTQVTYVPQSRTQQKGTPSELYYQAQVIMSPWHTQLWQLSGMADDPYRKSWPIHSLLRSQRSELAG